MFSFSDEWVKQLGLFPISFCAQGVIKGWLWVVVFFSIDTIRETMHLLTYPFSFLCGRSDWRGLAGLVYFLCSKSEWRRVTVAILLPSPLQKELINLVTKSCVCCFISVSDQRVNQTIPLNWCIPWFLSHLEITPNPIREIQPNQQPTAKPIQPRYSQDTSPCPPCAPGVDAAWDAWRKHVRIQMKVPDEENYVG